MKKKAALLSIVLSVCLLFTGCRDTLFELGISTSNTVIGSFFYALGWLDPAVRTEYTSGDTFDKAADQFFTALDARDVDAIKALFSPNSLAADTDIDETITQLFAFYPGPTDASNHNGETAGMTGSRDHGVWISQKSQLFPVFSSDTTYYCAMILVYQNEEDANEIGIQSLSLMSEKVVCDPYFEWNTDPGLHVMEDCEGDYETARVGGSPYIYTPYDRTITVEQLSDFLENSDSFDDFKALYGEPNNNTNYYIYSIYELEPENGERRFVQFRVEDCTGVHFEQGKIAYADILSSEEQLYRLWENEDYTDEVY